MPKVLTTHDTPMNTPASMREATPSTPDDTNPGGAALPAPTAEVIQLHPKITGITVKVADLELSHVVGDHEVRMVSLISDGANVRLLGSDYELRRVADMIHAGIDRVAA